jgi:hypothetical protein
LERTQAGGYYLFGAENPTDRSNREADGDEQKSPRHPLRVPQVSASF